MRGSQVVQLLLLYLPFSRKTLDDNNANTLCMMKELRNHYCLSCINLHKYFTKQDASFHELHTLFLTWYELHMTAVYYAMVEIKLKRILTCA